MTHDCWRLLAYGSAEAAFNMAFDEALLETAVRDGGATLRFYGWNRPSVSLGRFQKVEGSLLTELRRKNGIPVVRRITGGRGVLHGDDLTISLSARLSAIDLSPNSYVSAIYARLSAAYIYAFHELGIDLVVGSHPVRTGTERSGACFASASHADLIESASGCKMLGSAIRRHSDCILQQLSIPLGRPTERVGDNLLISDLFPGPAPNIAVTRPPHPLDLNLLAGAIECGFRREFGVSMDEGTPTRHEIDRTSTLETTRYRNPEWTLVGERSNGDKEIKPVIDLGNRL